MCVRFCVCVAHTHRNLNYWDSVSTLAGEVRDPSRTFPRAMLMAVALVVTMYLLPTLASLGVMPLDTDWHLGFYGKASMEWAWCQGICDAARNMAARMHFES